MRTSEGMRPLRTLLMDLKQKWWMQRADRWCEL